MTVTAAFLADLRSCLPSDQVLTSPEDLIVHGYDGTWLDHLPDVVVVPRTTANVAAIVQVACAHGVPLVPRGAGSGLAGGAVPACGGVVLSTTRMDQILAIDRSSLIAVVQPGVVNATLQNSVERLGLFYPPDPASLNQATIGGNVATSASGPRCLKYGGTKDYVVGLEVVLASGEVVRLGSRSHQPTADHHLLQAFIGSEGTLGVITEVAVRLIPKPEHRGTVMAAFNHLEDASDAVSRILIAGVVPLALEIMDQVTLRCVEEYLKVGLPIDSEAMLLFDVDGGTEAVGLQVDLVADVCRAAGAAIVQPAASDAESARLWRARRSTSSSFGRLRPNKLGEDISVPRSAVPTMVRAVQAIAREYDLLIPLFGHIGDGNLHPNILCDLRDRTEMTRVVAAARAIFAASIENCGVLSGEHGIGMLKRDFMSQCLDKGALALLRRIKRTVDPMGLLNPGKVFD
jgi:glycolate oxidase